MEGSELHVWAKYIWVLAMLIPYRNVCHLTLEMKWEVAILFEMENTRVH